MAEDKAKAIADLQDFLLAHGGKWISYNLYYKFTDDNEDVIKNQSFFYYHGIYFYKNFGNSFICRSQTFFLNCKMIWIGIRYLDEIDIKNIISETINNFANEYEFEDDKYIQEPFWNRQILLCFRDE